VAPVITVMTKHFMFNIRWIYILKFLYFNFFSDSFCITFLSDGTATSISKRILSFMFFIIMSGLFARPPYQFVPLDFTVLLYLHVDIPT
jgi:hypothetical protein